jgi:hypothetical protein
MEDGAYELSDVVLFEIPKGADVNQFYARIRFRWDGWTGSDDDVWLVAAELKADATDFAELLREVEAYVADTGLQAIRYCVDGRFHVMRAAAHQDAA